MEKRNESSLEGLNFTWYIHIRNMDILHNITFKVEQWLYNSDHTITLKHINYVTVFKHKIPLLWAHEDK